MGKEPLTGDQYHHGNLRAALLDSALETYSRRADPVAAAAQDPSGGR